MKRRVMNILAGVSLVLCIGMCVLWVRSYWRSDAWWFSDVEERAESRRVRTLLVYSGAGRVQLGIGRDILYGAQPSRPSHWFSYLVNRGPANPANTAVTAGWVKKFAGFGVINDWEVIPTGSAIKRWIAVSGGTLVIRESFRSVWAPHWFLAVVFAICPLRRVYLWRRVRVRSRGGRCLKCGYDMRGSGERCPECGEGVLRNTGEAPVPR